LDSLSHEKIGPQRGPYKKGGSLRRTDEKKRKEKKKRKEM
jgi:hypothetical protein